MATRTPAVAGMFYPAEEATARREVEDALRQAQLPDLPGPIKAAVVPHAGWAYSGPTAAHVFAALQEQEAPEAIVLLGAVHRWGVAGPSMYGSGSWQTPLGELEIDEELAQTALQRANDLGDGEILSHSPQAHSGEHSIEVQLPFIKHLFPDARILPVAVPPSSERPGRSSDASRVGRALAEAAEGLGRRAVAIGSSDLTHYGPRYGMAPAGVGRSALEWTRQNDRRIIDLMIEMRPEEVLSEAASHHNACGAGAIAAAIVYAQVSGATEGVLLHYTTSHDVMPTGAPSDMVGYAAVAFC